MPIKAKRQAAIPPGKHGGIIVEAHETTKVFDPQKGPEEVVEIIIQPEWREADGVETLQVAVLYSPVLNGLSSLSKALERLGQHPAEGESWDPASLAGTEVTFTAVQKGGFVNVNKDSLTKKE